MRYQMARTRLSSARHEAAHVVIGRRFNMKALYAVVHDAKDGEKGHVRWDMRSVRKVGPLARCIATMAGSLAESLWHGTPEGLVSDSDYETLLSVGLSPACMAELWVHTKRLVRSERKAIWELAERLVAHGKVDFRNGRRWKR